MNKFEKLPLESHSSDILQPSRSKRVDAVDWARGIAISLMILSHGIKGLLSFDKFPSWGLVPVHLVTKFSSSLFILVFGIALAIVHLPAVGGDDWPRKKTKLMVRGLVVFFWYKVLTIAEMTPLYSREEIVDALLYRGFPVYVEILGFYAIALLWVPLVLPLWKKTHVILKILFIAALTVLSVYLRENFNFWDSKILRALLVDHEDYYTWGQLSRAPLVFLGLLIGEWFRVSRESFRGLCPMVTGLGVTALLMFGVFAWNASPTLSSALISVALNHGKHPPELQFMLFSLSGAFLVLALAFWGGRRLAEAMAPITLIGKYPLQAFVFHIFVIFVFYRYLLNLWNKVSYSDAALLALLLLTLSSAWVKVLEWVKKRS